MRMCGQCKFSMVKSLEPFTSVELTHLKQLYNTEMSYIMLTIAANTSKCVYQRQHLDAVPLEK